MGKPGAGAEEQASRRARRIARLRDDAARGADVDEAMLRRALADQRAWSVGAEGERQVAEMLARMQRYGWTALHDVRWPGRPRANIDHIAIGPGGVVIIDAKNWSGTVAVQDGVLRQNGYRRERAVDGVAQASAAVTALLAPQHRTASRAVLCLAAQDQDREVVTSGSVDILGRWQLPEFLLTLPPRLSAYDTADIARHLTRELDSRTRQPTSRTASPRAPRVRTRATRSRPRRRRGLRALLLRLVLTSAGLWLVYVLATQWLAEAAARL